MRKPVYRFPGEKGAVYIHMKNNSFHGFIIYEHTFFVKCKILDGGAAQEINRTAAKISNLLLCDSPIILMSLIYNCGFHIVSFQLFPSLEACQLHDKTDFYHLAA